MDADLATADRRWAPKSKKGPIDLPDGRKIGFIAAPGDIRIELIQQVS